MAESLPEGIKEEVTCPVCLELFDHPLLLPCTHTFCKTCLETMLAKSAPAPHPSLRCPQCQETVSLPGGVGQLMKNILVANIVASLRKSQTDQPSVCVEEKSDTQEAKRGPDRSKQKSIQSQLRELLDVLESQQCATADHQERVQENLDKIARETAEKKRQVSDHFRKMTAQLQARERDLHQDVDASQVRVTSVLQGQKTFLESRMADLLSTMDKVFDLMKKNMSSAESSLQDEVHAASKETKRLGGSVPEVAVEDMESPAHLQLSGPSMDSFCQGITLSTTLRQEGRNQAAEIEPTESSDADNSAHLDKNFNTTTRTGKSAVNLDSQSAAEVNYTAYNSSDFRHATNDERSASSTQALKVDPSSYGYVSACATGDEKPASSIQAVRVDPSSCGYVSARATSHEKPAISIQAVKVDPSSYGYVSACATGDEKPAISIQTVRVDPSSYGYVSACATGDERSASSIQAVRVDPSSYGYVSACATGDEKPAISIQAVRVDPSSYGYVSACATGDEKPASSIQAVRVDPSSYGYVSARATGDEKPASSTQAARGDAISSGYVYVRATSGERSAASTNSRRGKGSKAHRK